MPSSKPAPDCDAEWVDSLERLRRLVDEFRPRLAVDPRLAIDTEFIRERTYRPVLEVVQLAAADGTVALLDVPAIGDIEPLAELLVDPGIVKIVHAGSQDFEILSERMSGGLPEPYFDTQVAAAFAGFGLQTGYGALVQSALGVRIDKEEGFADWSRRPLTPSMLAYAANDVRYLHALHGKLHGRLERRGRLPWAMEQMDRILRGATETLDPTALWTKVGGKQGLDGAGLAVLRELAIWRDEEARRRDRPRRTVLKDEPLVEVARRRPKSHTAILELRSMPPNAGERVAREMASRVERALAQPRESWPRIESQPGLDDHGAALLELLSAVVRVRAMEEDLPPSLMASSDDLRTLAIHRRNPPQDGPLLSGWRGMLLGDDLRAALEGRLSVAWDPKPGRLVLRRDEPSTQSEP